MISTTAVPQNTSFAESVAQYAGFLGRWPKPQSAPQGKSILADVLQHVKRRSSKMKMEVKINVKALRHETKRKGMGIPCPIWKN